MSSRLESLKRRVATGASRVAPEITRAGVHATIFALSHYIERRDEVLASRNISPERGIVRTIYDIATREAEILRNTDKVSMLIAGARGVLNGLQTPPRPEANQEASLTNIPPNSLEYAQTQIASGDLPTVA